MYPFFIPNYFMPPPPIAPRQQTIDECEECENFAMAVSVLDESCQMAADLLDKAEVIIDSDLFESIVLDNDDDIPVAYVTRRTREVEEGGATFDEIEYETSGFPVKMEGVTIVPFINGTALGPNCDGWKETFKPNLNQIEKAARGLGKSLEWLMANPGGSYNVSSRSASDNGPDYISKIECITEQVNGKFVPDQISEVLK